MSHQACGNDFHCTTAGRLLVNHSERTLRDQGVLLDEEDRQQIPVKPGIGSGNWFVEESTLNQIKGLTIV